MAYYLIMCKSITNAQRAARFLEKKGITAIIARAPQSVAKDGCAYCLKVTERRVKTVLEILEPTGLNSGRVFEQDEDGSTREANL